MRCGPRAPSLAHRGRVSLRRNGFLSGFCEHRPGRYGVQVVSAREPRRPRPFFVEVLIVLALAWAGVQWLRPPGREARIAATTAADPQATGSVGLPARAALQPMPAGDPDAAAVKSVLG